MSVLARPILLCLMTCLMHVRKGNTNTTQTRTTTALWKTQTDFKSCFMKCHQDNVCASFKFKQETSQCAGYPRSTITSGGGHHGTLFNFCKRVVCTKANGYRWLPRSMMCIRVYFNPKTWPDSRKACKAEHGDLAVINSKLKTKSVLHFIKSFDPKVWTKMDSGVRIWIGMRRRHNSYIYNWINGNTGYKAWAKQDPSFREEECVMFTHKGVGDVRCWTERFYLCQLF